MELYPQVTSWRAKRQFHLHLYQSRNSTYNREIHYFQTLQRAHYIWASSQLHTHYFRKVNFETTVPSKPSSPQRPLSHTTHTNFYPLLVPCAFCMSCQCHTPRCIHLKLWIIRRLTINNSIMFILFTVCTTCLVEKRWIDYLSYLVFEVGKISYWAPQQLQLTICLQNYTTDPFISTKLTQTHCTNRQQTSQSNTHLFLVTISMHSTDAVRYRKQTVWTVL